MKILHSLQGFILFFGSLLPLNAQDKPDFSFGFDRGAHALILGDYDASTIQPNKDG